MTWRIRWLWRLWCDLRQSEANRTFAGKVSGAHWRWRGVWPKRIHRALVRLGIWSPPVFRESEFRYILTEEMERANRDFHRLLLRSANPFVIHHATRRDGSNGARMAELQLVWDEVKGV